LDENDSVAALKIGITKGYKIPEELSIIGFADGILASRRLTPSLTTIVNMVSKEIGSVLIDRLESKEKTFLMKQLSLKQN
jgi:LacI family transcriptional regulator